MLRLLALCAALGLAACQSASEDWPSLAYRPGEGRPMACGGNPTAPAPAPTPATETASDSPAPFATAPLTQEARAICARLDTLERNWATAAQKAEAAVSAAAQAPAGSPEWGSAQIAISQLDKIGSDLGEQQRRADDLVQSLRRAGLADAEDVSGTRADDVARILNTATRAGDAVRRHITTFNSLTARLAPAQ